MGSHQSSSQTVNNNTQQTYNSYTTSVGTSINTTSINSNNGDQGSSVANSNFNQSPDYESAQPYYQPGVIYAKSVNPQMAYQPVSSIDNMIQFGNTAVQPTMDPTFSTTQNPNLDFKSYAAGFWNTLKTISKKALQGYQEMSTSSGIVDTILNKAQQIAEKYLGKQNADYLKQTAKDLYQDFKTSHTYNDGKYLLDKGKQFYEQYGGLFKDKFYGPAITKFQQLVTIYRFAYINSINAATTKFAYMRQSQHLLYQKDRKFCQPLINSHIKNSPYKIQVSNYDVFALTGRFVSIQLQYYLIMKINSMVQRAQNSKNQKQMYYGKQNLLQSLDGITLRDIQIPQLMTILKNLGISIAHRNFSQFVNPAVLAKQNGIKGNSLIVVKNPNMKFGSKHHTHTYVFVLNRNEKQFKNLLQEMQQWVVSSGEHQQVNVFMSDVYKRHAIQFISKGYSNLINDLRHFQKVFKQSILRGRILTYSQSYRSIENFIQSNSQQRITLTKQGKPLGKKIPKLSKYYVLQQNKTKPNYKKQKKFRKQRDQQQQEVIINVIPQKQESFQLIQGPRSLNFKQQFFKVQDKGIDDIHNPFNL